MGKECTENKAVRKLVPPIIKALGVCSAVSIPLKNGSEAFGLLDMARHDLFTTSDMKRLETIAEQLSNIIQRKQIEEALKVSEQNFRTFLDNSSLGIRIRGKDRGHRLRKPDFSRHLRLSKHRGVPITSAARILHQGKICQLPRTQEKDRLRVRRCPEKLEVDIVRKDGTVRHIQVFGHLVDREGKRQSHTFYNDVTELYQVGARH